MIAELPSAAAVGQLLGHQDKDWEQLIRRFAVGVVVDHHNTYWAVLRHRAVVVEEQPVVVVARNC